MKCLLLLIVCSPSYWGKLSWYDGSGYIAIISNDSQAQLESSGWIDRRFVLSVISVAIDITFIQSDIVNKRSKNFDKRPNRRQKICDGVKIV